MEVPANLDKVIIYKEVLHLKHTVKSKDFT